MLHPKKIRFICREVLSFLLFFFVTKKNRDFITISLTILCGSINYILSSTFFSSFERLIMVQFVKYIRNKNHCKCEFLDKARCGINEVVKYYTVLQGKQTLIIILVSSNDHHHLKTVIISVLNISKILLNIKLRATLVRFQSLALLDRILIQFKHFQSIFRIYRYVYTTCV